MRRFFGKLSLVLAAVVLLNTFPDLQREVVKANSTDIVYINVENFDYDTGTLSVSWSGTHESKTVIVEYINPDTGQIETLPPYTDVTGNKVAIPGLRENIVYAIEIKTYRPHDMTTPVEHGFLCYLPRMTFRAVTVEENQQDCIDWEFGREIGTKPALKLTWTVPRTGVPNLSGGYDFLPINTPGAMAYIADKMSQLYQKTVDPDGVPDFKIVSYMYDLGSSETRLVDVNVDVSAGGTFASVSGVPDLKAEAAYNPGSAEMELYLVGRKDDRSPLPKDDQDKADNWSEKWEKLVPSTLLSLPDVRDRVLFNPGILPGTMYRMAIMPVFKDSLDNDVITVGKNDPRSFLSGKAYVYTPIRFQLVRDENNNLAVMIHKLNGGSPRLPNIVYHVQAGDASPPLEGDIGDPANPLVTVSDMLFPQGSVLFTTAEISEPSVSLNYKVVARYGGSSICYSCHMSFRLIDYASGSPTPLNVRIEPLSNDASVEIPDPRGGGGTIVEKTTDIRISWQKPANWETEILPNTDESKDVYYHVLLNTYRMDEDATRALEANGIKYGEFLGNYRLAFYFSSKAAREDPEDPGRLYVDIKGDELFKGIVFTGQFDNGKPVTELVDIPADELLEPDYPKFLLPNKVYYAQLYTTLGVNKRSSDPSHMSPPSDIVTFTTHPGASDMIPVPYNFNYSENGIYTDGQGGMLNYVKLEIVEDNMDFESFRANRGQSQGVTLNVYYEIYMARELGVTPAPSPEELNFEYIGVVEGTGVKGPVPLVFTVGLDGVTKLLPDTTYYFKVLTKLIIDQGKSSERVIVSDFSAIRSVTTLRDIVIGPPDPSGKRPRAPVDFTYNDDSGQSTLVGSSVTFSWTRQEDDKVGADDIRYTVVASSAALRGQDPLPNESDYIYRSFTSTFGGSLQRFDPGQDVNSQNFEFYYDEDGGKYRLIIKNWLSPNRLYFFSIRAEWASADEGGDECSEWVCVPLTTPLIPAPSKLEAVRDCQLGFFWYESQAPQAAPEDFSVEIRKKGTSAYEKLPRARYTLLKAEGRFYGRVYNLEPDTEYDVRVTIGGQEIIVYPEREDFKTRDCRHEIEVKWMGLPGSYTYKLAIRSAEDNEYMELEDEDLEPFRSGEDFYLEETGETAGNPYSFMYARIKSVRVTLPNGNVERRPLKSNMKYYIKVRAVKVEQIPGIGKVESSSVYVGPVEMRTDFDRDEYDKEEQDKGKELLFADKIERLEREIYWKMDMNDPVFSRVLLKSDRVLDMILNGSGSGFEFEMPYTGKLSDVVYIPEGIVRALNDHGKSFTLIFDGAEYSFKPDTIDLSALQELKELKKDSRVRGVYIKVTVSRREYSSYGFPQGHERASKINRLEVRAVGSPYTWEELKNMISNKLYNADSGLVNLRLNQMRSYSTAGIISPDQLDSYIEEIVLEVENELSYYIGDLVEGPGAVLGERAVKRFSKPVTVELCFPTIPGTPQPYVRYDGESRWTGLSALAVNLSGQLAFEVTGMGEYVVLQRKSGLDGIPDDFWAKESLTAFVSRYDITRVFEGSENFIAPEMYVTVGEMVRLYVLVTSGQDFLSPDMEQKVKRTELKEVLGAEGNLKDVSRQQMAAVLFKLYCRKTGADMGSLAAGRRIYIRDFSAIDGRFVNAVELMLDMGVLRLDPTGRFNPGSPVTRAEAVDAFVKALRLSGEEL